MPRHTTTVTVTAEGRDKGKRYILTEMPSAQAEGWAMRAFLAMCNAGAKIPEDVATAGLAGVAMMGLSALGGLTFAQAGPLLEELMGCVQIMPDPARPEVVRPLSEDASDVEEVATRLLLRAEVFKLHTDFFSAGMFSQLAALLPARTDKGAPKSTP